MASGDSNPVRDLGHVVLHDPYAALEDRDGAAFAAALGLRGSEFQAALAPRKDAVERMTTEVEEMLEAALPKTPNAAQETLLWQARTVYIQHGYGNKLNVWINSADSNERAFENLESFGVDCASNLYFTITDVGDGDQTFRISVYELGVFTPQYSITGVGPNAAFHGDYLYYEGVENQLRSSSVLRVKKDNGRNRARVFHSADKRFQVELHAPPRQPDLFIRITNALSQRLAIINGASYRWLTPPPREDGAGETLLPVCADLYASNAGLVYKGHLHAFPPAAHLENAAPLNSAETLVSTVKYAKTNLYIFNHTTCVYNLLFEAQEPCNIMIHDNSTIPSVTITSYYAPNTVYEIQGDALVKVKSLPQPLKLTRHASGVAESRDGADVPYTFVSAAKKPKKVLVIAYGAYGLSSGRAYPKRWLPWLRRGYAVAEAAPRGGRECGDAWYDMGRTAARKIATFEDTAAVIKAVQKRFGFKKENTAMYGRSAGGWTAAYIGLKYPQLVGAVYAEVPYLDVIRTASNPALPLTQLEYDEFGDPHRSKDYEALLQISPVDAAEMAPQHAPLFLVRSALNDTQVYPYESLKFAAKATSLGWPVLVGIDAEGGHFVKRSSAAKIFAEDFVLIDGALKGKQSARKTRRRPYARTSPRSHKARGTIRQRRSSRKH
jgi:protease II